MENNEINWRRYPKSRQKEFLAALAEKDRIKGVKQEAVVQAQWYRVLNYCFADYSKNQSKSKSNRLSRSVSNFYENKDNIDNSGRYATHMEKLLDTDGLMFVHDITVALNLIAEFKDDVKMDKRLEQERILGQVIFYLKHIKQHIAAGNELHLELPNVVLAADANQAFVINARALYPYLELNIDWDKYTARGFYDTLKPTEIFEKLSTDQNINPYVYDLRSKDFDINDIIGLAADLASTDLDENLKKIPVNQANIRGVYDEFLRLVTQDKTKVAHNQELVSMFITALTDHEAFTLKNNTAILMEKDATSGEYRTNGQYRVNGRNWYAFFSRFDTNYSADEVKNITAVGDVLLKETERRFSGEYWTPTIWANKAIDTLSEVLGTDWKQKYYVWDNAAGSKNLTRDYKFKNLFSSTLFEKELSIGREYNVDNVAFQYDFLNDDPDLNPDNILQSKLANVAPGLAEAIKDNKPLIFFTNPPYGTSGNTVGKKSKTDIAKTEINKQMHDDNMGHASENLYCQFFYRAVQIKETFNLSNVVIAYFSNSQYLTSSNYFNPLRKKIFSNFDFKKGFLFNAGEFSDTASSWGIAFTILQSKKSDTKNIPDNYKLEVDESDINGINSIGTHVIYDFSESDGLAQWVKSINIRNAKNIKDTVPLVTGPFTASKAKPNLFYPENGLGYAWFKGNNVEYADRETGLFSTDYSRQRGTAITPDNFERTMVNFAVRRATQHTWINNKDSYHKPDTAFNDDRVALTDMVVYSIFNDKNLASSLKGIDYRGETVPITNELFWMSKDTIGKYAARAKYADMGFAIDRDHNRFMYKWLKENQQYLSSEAKDVLDLAKLVVKETFNQRKILDDDYIEKSFMSWDAGWEQIRKLMLYGQKVDSYTQLFIPSYKKLEEKINEYIYKYGFLQK